MKRIIVAFIIFCMPIMSMDLFAIPCQSAQPMPAYFFNLPSPLLNQITNASNFIMATAPENSAQAALNALRFPQDLSFENRMLIATAIGAFYCQALQESPVSENEKIYRWSMFLTSANIALNQQNQISPNQIDRPPFETDSGIAPRTLSEIPNNPSFHNPPTQPNSQEFDIPQSRAVIPPIGRTGSGAPDPDPTPKPTPTATSEDVDAILAKFPKGSAAIIAPKEGIQYEGFDVSLRLAHKDYAEFLRGVESSLPQGTVAKGISGVRMSPSMAATLIGEDFIIENGENTLQLVTLNEDTIWSWRVRSETPGTHNLTAQLQTMASINGKETPRTINISQASISIKISPSGWVQRHWEWIATVIVLPIIGWGVGRFLPRPKN